MSNQLLFFAYIVNSNHSAHQNLECVLGTVVVPVVEQQFKKKYFMK